MSRDEETRERAKSIAHECIAWFSPKLTRAEAELEITKIIERVLTNAASACPATSTDIPAAAYAEPIVAFTPDDAAKARAVVAERDRFEFLWNLETKRADAAETRVQELALQVMAEIAAKEQRERRIAELEAALRSIEGLLCGGSTGIGPGSYEAARLARAALAAPASPATASPRKRQKGGHWGDHPARCIDHWHEGEPETQTTPGFDCDDCRDPATAISPPGVSLDSHNKEKP